jgi:hypothetical protein
MILPVNPAAAWQVAMRHGPYEPISFVDYWSALNRLPNTSIAELDIAQTDVTMAAILVCRAVQINRLRARWLISK